MTQVQATGNKFSTSIIVSFVVLFVALLLTIPYKLTQMGDRSSVELNVSFYADKTFNLDLESAILLPTDTWEHATNFNFGLHNEPYWLKINIPTQNFEQKRLLLLNYGLLDHVDVWMLAPPSHNSSLLSAHRVGDAYPYNDRMINYEQFLFSIPDADHDIVVYMRLKSKGPIKAPIEMWQESDFIEYASLHKIFMGVFFGFMVAMSLSNLFIYSATRNTIFAIYTGYVSSIGVAVAAIHGMGFHYLWPNNLWLQEFSVPIFTGITMIFIISLTIKLLELQQKSPKIYRVLSYLRYVFVALLSLCLIAPYEIIIVSLLVLLVIATPIILLSGIVLASKGNEVARYFCGAWSVLLISGLSIAMENFGVYQSPIDSIYLIMVGAIAESLLLALALAVKYTNQLRVTKEVRTNALKTEQDALAARDELIALQEQNRSDLEYSIEERTLELEVALRELAEKNLDLERLSAIDPLTNLMNRRYFDKRLLAESRRSRRELTPLGLAMLDIDFFKKINDNYGHLCGDYCLQVFSGLLKEYVKRPSDVVCRYGGEEFVLILPNTDDEGLFKLLEKIRQSVQDKKILFEGNEIPMTVSIGGCSRVVASDDEHSLLLAFVDKKLYQAKETGRNQVIVESY